MTSATFTINQKLFRRLTFLFSLPDLRIYVHLNSGRSSIICVCFFHIYNFTFPSVEKIDYTIPYKQIFFSIHSYLLTITGLFCTGLFLIVNTTRRFYFILYKAASKYCNKRTKKITIICKPVLIYFRHIIFHVHCIVDALWSL